MSSYKSFKKGKKAGKCRALYGAFSKYGVEQFVIKEFKTTDDEKLDDEEIFYIKVFNTISPNGYNLRNGGARGLHSSESKEKMRVAKLGSNNHNFGKPRSEEFKKIMSEKKKGDKHHFFGKKLNQEHLVKLSESHKKGGNSESLPMYMVYLKARPECYASEGYVIANHPKLKNKQFTSKKLSLEEKYNLAIQYLNQIIE